MGDGSPGSREAEGEGGEGFYITRGGSKFDLLVISGGGEQDSGEDGSMLPFLFWRASIGRRRSPPSGAAEVSRGDPWGDPLTYVSPRVLPRAPT